MEVIQLLLIIIGFIVILALSTIGANQKKLMEKSERIEQKLNKLMDERKNK